MWGKRLPFGSTQPSARATCDFFLAREDLRNARRNEPDRKGVLSHWDGVCACSPLWPVAKRLTRKLYLFGCSAPSGGTSRQTRACARPNKVMRRPQVARYLLEVRSSVRPLDFVLVGRSAQISTLDLKEAPTPRRFGLPYHGSPAVRACGKLAARQIARATACRVFRSVVQRLHRHMNATPCMHRSAAHLVTEESPAPPAIPRIRDMYQTLWYRCRPFCHLRHLRCVPARFRGSV